MKRKWIRPLDLAIAGGVLLLGLALLLVLCHRPRGEVARVTVNGTLYASLPLSEHIDGYAVETERGTLRLRVTEDGVAVTDSDCPDDLCVRTGSIARRGESIVCAPLGVCITVGESRLDGVTG